MPRLTNVWIDTDIALDSPFRDPDDAFALAAAAGSPEIRIAGVSVSYGNGSLRLAESSARGLVKHLRPDNGLTSERIFAGADSPAAIEGISPATEALAVALAKQPLTYLALAPLTNLAAFLGAYPGLENRIARVIFIGGQFRPGKVSLPPFRVHDANVFKDPAAARRVLLSGIPLAFLPPEISGTLRFISRELPAAAVAAKYLHRKTTIWRIFWKVFAPAEGAPVFDALALLAAADPALAPMQKGSASMNESSELILSVTAKNSRAREVEICADFDRAPARQSLLRRLAQST